jgi:protein-disulfide isomerase
MWKSRRGVAVLAVTLLVGVGLGALVERGTGERKPVRAAAPAAVAPSAGQALVYRVPVDDSAVKGPEDALVTLVEVSDFQCPFCKRAAPTLKQIEATYGGKVRFVFKHNPLAIHDKAMAAAVAAEQARAQGGDGKFWEMHDQLFSISPELDRTMLVPAAERIGLDVSTFRAGLDSGKLEARIHRDQQLVASLGANATPTFFVNGRKLEGALPFEQLRSVIDEELASAEKRVKAGTPAKQVYAAIIEQGLTRAPAPPPSAPAAPAASRIPVRADDPVRGPKVAKVTVVLFSDFQCPFCGRVEPTLKQISEAYPGDVRIVWKHQPLPMHPSAMPAAEAAEAAHEQRKFWEMHDRMFAAQQQLSPAQYETWARELHLDLGKFRGSIEQHRSRGRIEEDVKLASAVGATATPTLFLNCRQVVGARPFEELKGIIDQEIEKASDLISAGTKLDGAFYDEMCDRNVKAVVAQAPAPAPAVAVPLRSDDPMRGNARAPVTIVVFSDFQCPFCVRAEDTLGEVRKAYGEKIRIAWKHQPLSIHPNAFPAAVASEAAREQGKFWEMHDRMFANQAALSAESYERWARELGLDVDRFRRSLQERKLAQRVADDASLGSRIGAGGTPTFFVNGERVLGAVSFEQMKVVIDRQLGRSAHR